MPIVPYTKKTADSNPTCSLVPSLVHTIDYMLYIYVYIYAMYMLQRPRYLLLCLLQILDAGWLKQIHS